MPFPGNAASLFDRSFVTTIDSHTQGKATRLIADGFPEIPVMSRLPLWAGSEAADPFQRGYMI